jgi:hypothetical protein
MANQTVTLEKFSGEVLSCCVLRADDLGLFLYFHSGSFCSFSAFCIFSSCLSIQLDVALKTVYGVKWDVLLAQTLPGA